MFPALSDVSSFRDNELRPHKNATVDVYKQIYQVAALVRKNVFAILAILEQVVEYTQQPDLSAHVLRDGSQCRDPYQPSFAAQPI